MAPKKGKGGGAGKKKKALEKFLNETKSHFKNSFKALGTSLYMKPLKCI
jgi:hypothetical protein